MFNFFLNVLHKFLGIKSDIDSKVNKDLIDQYNKALDNIDNSIREPSSTTSHYFCWSVIVKADKSQIVIGNPAVIDSEGPIEAAWIYHNNHIPLDIKKYCQAHNIEIVTQSRFVND